MPIPKAQMLIAWLFSCDSGGKVEVFGGGAMWKEVEVIASVLSKGIVGISPSSCLCSPASAIM